MVEVMKGGCGRSVKGFFWTSLTVKVVWASGLSSALARGSSRSTTRSRAASLSLPLLGSKSLPTATRLPSSSMSSLLTRGGAPMALARLTSSAATLQ